MLEHPPIVEVACGIVFQPVDVLDALGLGVYWGTRASEYPDKSLVPAINDTITLNFGAVPMRAFLVHRDDQFVLQLQHDRFFMNWRARGRGYPRFSERHGPDGLLKKTLAEFTLFREFVWKQFRRELNVVRVDLAKIDLLVRGVIWHDLEDLARLVPLTGVFREIQPTTTSRQLNLVFLEKGQTGDASVSIVTAMNGTEPSALKLEARMNVSSTNDTIGASFEQANEVLNRAFFKLISPTELRRFKEKP